MIFKLSIIINCISREHSSKYVLNESLNVWLRIAFVTRKSPGRENVFKPMPVNGEENIFSNTSCCGGQSNIKNLSIIVQDPRTSYLVVNICSLFFLKANGFYIYFSFQLQMINKMKKNILNACRRQCSHIFYVIF